MNSDARQQAEAFVREVETAMIGVSHRQRTALTAGLIDHLLEPGDDGQRPIDDHPDPASYAGELRALATTEGNKPPRRSIPLTVGVTLLAVVVACTWIGLAQPWSSQPAPEPVTSPPSAPAQTQVPDVRGLNEDTAVNMLKSAGFSVVTVMDNQTASNPSSTGTPRGEVFDTEPFAGTTVDLGSEVLVILNP